jgi:hypothetical protein
MIAQCSSATQTIINLSILYLFIKSESVVHHSEFHLMIAKGIWKMLRGFVLYFESNYCFCMLNFFFQLSSVVDLRVSLNIWRVLKMFFWVFFTVFSHVLIEWVFIYTVDFLFFGKSVHHFSDFETTTIKFCWFPDLLKNRSFFWFSLFGNFSLFLYRILLLIWYCCWLCSFFYITKLFWLMFTFS